MDLTLLPRSLDAGGLARHPLIRSARAGQTHGRKIRLVWHDGPERPLAKHGLALCEESGVWRLERHAPEGDETWPPGLDHRLVETVSGPGGLTRLPSGTMPEDLEPVAAFEGRRTVFPLTVGGVPVTLTLLHGVLRLGEDTWPAARLRLEGPAAAVRAQALVLGQGLDVSVSTRGLAAEALSRAGGPVPAPDWRGAPAPMTRGLSVTEAFAHVLSHLTGVLLLMAPLVADPASGPEPVHQMRVASRRARSALKLFRLVVDGPDLTRAADSLKQLGRRLGMARDRDVFMTETLPAVEAALSGPQALAPLKRAGVKRRAEARAALAVWVEGPECRLLCLELACLAMREEMPTSGPDTPPGEERTEPAQDSLPVFAATVLGACWKSLRKAGKGLAGREHAEVHDFRLKAKRMRYATEFFAPLFPGGPTARFLRRLAALQEHLGVFNDAAVAATLPATLGLRPGLATGVVLGFMTARGAGIRPALVKGWKRLRRREPFWL